MQEIERLWTTPDKSPEAERLGVLALLVEHYEKTNFPIEDPDPIELLEHVMHSRGLTRKDFEPAIGQRGRVTEIFNRVRPSSLEMIRPLMCWSSLMRCAVRCCQLKADQLFVALNYFGKTLAIAQIVCYKRINFGKSPSLAAFFTKDSSVCPFKH